MGYTVTFCPAETVGKVPRFFSDIGKNARDLLYLDKRSLSDSKFTITTSSASLLTSITVENEPAYPGLKTIFTFKARSAKVELQYLQNYYGLTSSICLASNPTLNFSAALRNNDLVMGGEVSFDAIRGALTKYNIGASFTTSYLVASLALKDKFDTLNASYYHKMGPFCRTAVGAEVEHNFSRNKDKITVGTQCAVNRLTTATVRLNSLGKASVAIERVLSPVSITVSAEVEARSVVQSAKFGLGLAVRERVTLFD